MGGLLLIILSTIVAVSVGLWWYARGKRKARQLATAQHAHQTTERFEPATSQDLFAETSPKASAHAVATNDDLVGPHFIGDPRCPTDESGPTSREQVDPLVDDLDQALEPELSTFEAAVGVPNPYEAEVEPLLLSEAPLDTVTNAMASGDDEGSGLEIGKEELPTRDVTPESGPSGLALTLAERTSDQSSTQEESVEQPGKTEIPAADEVRIQESEEQERLSGDEQVHVPSASGSVSQDGAEVDRPTLESPAANIDASGELSPRAEIGSANSTTIPTEPLTTPTYRSLAPVNASAPTRPRRVVTPGQSQSPDADLRLRVQLVFNRRGEVKTLALVPDRREGMPSEVEVSGTQAKVRFTELRDDCYEPVLLLEPSNALREGVVWRGRSDAHRWRWRLGGRELYVLAPGDEFGLHGFVSTARLWLNTRHVILAGTDLRDEVLAALSEAGCVAMEVSDETTPGVPSGWLLFRNVTPTRPVQMRNEAHILNALCPLPDIEPHFVGGIRLERGTWLLGYPPHIRLTGDLNGLEVKLDGRPITVGDDCSITAPGWYTEGEHQLWLGGQTQTYTLRTIEENWQRWPAYDFGLGAAICGASIDSTSRSNDSHQVIVPATNPLLVGARAGEVLHCHTRDEVRAENFLIFAPFQPVWALPADPAHANKGSARILLLRAIEPMRLVGVNSIDRSHRQKLQRWTSVLNDASKKRLRVEPDNAAAMALWSSYRKAARQLRRELR